MDPVIPVVPQDPWEDPEFAPLDLRSGPDHLARLIAADANANPNDYPASPEPVVDPAMAPVVPVAVAPQYAAPDTVTLEDGSSVTTTNDVEGWHATVDPGNGRTIQVYHARTERELIRALMVAQANATKKINQQEKRLKLVQKVDEPAPVKPGLRQLTADQIFEIKTLQQTDPGAAYDKLIEYRTGRTFEQFYNDAEAGRQAAEKQTRAEIASAFFAKRPAYQITQANEAEMLKYLNERKKTFTAENLTEAFDDLLEAGLLPDVAKPRPVIPQAAPQPAAITAVPELPATPVVLTAPARIERPVGRTNATFGLRANETTTVRPSPNPEVPSVEELENLPDDEIARLFAGVRQVAAQSSRR